jgi:hypothetical protein
MKKLLSVVLVLALILIMSVSCTGSNNSTPTPTPDQSTGSNNSGGIVKLGLGQNISIASSKNADDENGPVGQADTVMAAVGIDAEGKVVSVTIDTAQARVNFDKDGNMTTDPAVELKTKAELGDDYGMKARSEVGEWYEQIAALEKWMTGKTVDEIRSLKTNDKNAPDDPELTSLVTISVQDYIAAVAEAFENAREVNGAEKVGLGHVISVAKSKGIDGENGPVAQVDTVMAAAAFTADGKTAGVIIDTAQVRVNFDTDGKLSSDPAAELKTKVELGDDYGMKARSEVGEWYEQIAELEKWMAGKTIEEIRNLKTNENSAPDVPELTSLVTISVQDYIASVSEAYDKAK